MSDKKKDDRTPAEVAQEKVANGEELSDADVQALEHPEKDS